MKMLTRKFGREDWDVSVIGLGTWNLGGQWGAISDSEALKVIDTAIENGINLIDTADAYGEPPGRSEALIGRALAGRRDKVFLVSKAGNWGKRFGHEVKVTHPMHIQMFCDASLYRMKTDVIDVYLCHLASLADPDMWLEGFRKLKEQGKIRSFGISSDSIETVKAFAKTGECSAVELEYSLVNRKAEKELLPFCLENRIAVIVRGPLAMGVCAGKYTTETKFSDSVRSRFNEGKDREQFLRNVGMIDKLKFLENSSRPMARAALQFVLAHPAVTSIIPGAKSPGQVIENARAGSDPQLNSEELAKIRKITG